MDILHSDDIVGANAGRTSRARFTICEFGEIDHEPGKVCLAGLRYRSRLRIFRPMNKLVDRVVSCSALPSLNPAGAKAMSEYNAEREAERAKTVRLKALRETKEAAVGRYPNRAGEEEAMKNNLTARRLVTRVSGAHTGDGRKRPYS